MFKVYKPLYQFHMKLLCTLFLLLAMTAAHAQRSAGLFDNSHLMPEANQILAGQVAGKYKTAKITATKSRLIAFADFFPGVGTDSFTFVYSGNRGSSKILTALYPVIGFSNNGDAFINADSMSRYTSPPSLPNAPRVLRYTDYCTYDAADRIQTRVAHGGGSTKNKFFFSYNAAGYATRLLTGVSPVAQNTFTDVRDEHFRLNALNQVIFDSVYISAASRPDWRRYNYYDASNRLASSARYGWIVATSSWVKQDSLLYTYYPNDLLKTSVKFTYSSTSINGTKDSFGYTGSNPLNTYSLSFSSTAGGPWITTYRTSSTLRPGGENYVNRMLEGYTGSAWVSEERILGFFNADSTIRRGELYHYTGGVQDATPYYSLNYYYEQYGTPPPALVRFAYKGEALGIYPNPAGAYVMVPLPTMQARSGHLEVWDAAGRKIMSKECRNNVTERLDISQWPVGWYGVRVSSEDGGLVGSGRFVKK